MDTSRVHASKLELEVPSDNVTLMAAPYRETYTPLGITVARWGGMEARMAWYDDYIDCVDGVQGGFPVIRGTRTPVRSIVTLFLETYPRDLAAVEQALLHLNRQEIRAALAFSRDNPAIVEADRTRQQKAERILSAQ